MIGIVGKAHAGKTTLANFLYTLLPNTKIVKFADPLYTYLEIFTNEKKRLFLQELADLTKKHFSKEIFVNIMEKTILKNLDKILICDDVRFPEELQLLKKYKFKLIGLDIPEHIRKERANGVDWNPDHISEKYDLFSECDFIINTVEYYPTYKKLYDKLYEWRYLQHIYEIY